MRNASFLARALSIAVMLCIAGSSRALSEASHIADLARPSGEITHGPGHAPAGGVTKPATRHRAGHDSVCDAIVAVVVSTCPNVEQAPDRYLSAPRARETSAGHGRAPPLDISA